MSREALKMYREVVAVLTAPDGPFCISQPESARTRAFAQTDTNLIDFFDRIVATFPDRDMLQYEGARWTYRSIMAGAEGLGAALRARYDIRPGDRVGIAMHNCPNWFVGFLAVTRIGAVAALLNSRGAPDEIAAAAERVDCRIVLCDDRCAERLHDITEIPLLNHDAMLALVAEGGPDTTPVRTDTDDAVVILFTSGTTGRPKGATLTQRNICSMVRTLDYLGTVGQTMAARRAGMEFEQLRSLMPPPSVLLIFPLFHISGLVTFITAASGGGLATILRRWDPAVALDLIEANRVAHLSGPSMIMADLLDQPGASERLKSVRGVVIGGQASPIALTDRIRSTLPGASQGAGWGMTEVTGSISSASGPVFDAYPGSVGLVLPLADVRICDPQGAEVSLGQVGEMQIRGATVMKGYWDDPVANAQAFEGEWLRTGDMGRFDEDGMLYLVDRAKDMVISAGENIYCAEVERVLGMVEHHAEVALFGVPDDRLGERAVAAVVIRQEANLAPDAEAVRQHARQHLADYKVPSEILFDLGPLPRNVLGKVDKAELAKRYHARRESVEMLASIGGEK
jgi:long-chain acyl-CoA synthetase